MEKLSLCVLFGGCSSEYEVSLMSVTSILNNLDREKYDIYMVGITRDGRWLLYEGEISNLRPDRWNDRRYVTPAILSPDRADHGLLVLREGGVQRIRLDVIFPVLHGKNGEDGTVQGLFELCGVPYVGCGVLASAICMDKDVAYSVLTQRGIPSARSICVREGELLHPEMVARKLREAALSYPVFVKPANAGSSVGISKVHGEGELLPALQLALREDGRGKAIVQEFLDGIEVECAVLGNGDPVASADVGEIEPLRELYDYEGKYCDDTTALHIPARLPSAKAQEVREIAVRAFRAMNCQGLARVDFFVLHKDGRVVLNELNTLPGFTDISMYPKLFCHGGMGYGELLDRLIELALGR